jgi:hypothetical protein
MTLVAPTPTSAEISTSSSASSVSISMLGLVRASGASACWTTSSNRWKS